MLFSLADFRAKRTLLEERGLLGLSRYTAMDELRIKTNILFTRGHFKVLVDGRVEGAKRKRTYVPSPVTLSFPGFTLTLTVSLDGTKLAPMLRGDWPRVKGPPPYSRADSPRAGQSSWSDYSRSPYTPLQNQIFFRQLSHSQ